MGVNILLRDGGFETEHVWLSRAIIHTRTPVNVLLSGGWNKR
jgi:hypothetical protein